jgi:hypothetical protein
VFDYPYESVRAGVSPTALRIVCRPTHDAPTWQRTLPRHASESDDAFCARARDVARYLEVTAGGGTGNVTAVIQCVYEPPAAPAQCFEEADNIENVLTMLWWLAQSTSPRVPEKAACNALRALCKAYGWNKRAVSLETLRNMNRPCLSALVCVPQRVH